MTRHSHIANPDSAAGLLGEVVLCRLDVINGALNLLANQLLAQELTGLKQPGNVIQGPEVLTRGTWCIYLSLPARG